jgi:hypothetical protein
MERVHTMLQIIMFPGAWFNATSFVVMWLCSFRFHEIIFSQSSRPNSIFILYSGVSRDVQFTPTARVPVLKYVSNHFDISCDISINNYPGRTKSRVLYWLNTLDGRFGDMVLLVSILQEMVYWFNKFLGNPMA